MTILSITHDIEEAVFADNVILLNNGEIKDIGESISLGSTQIFSNPKAMSSLTVEPIN